MASNKNSSSNRVEVPEARDAMDRFKMEVANELGVNLKQGYNGDINVLFLLEGGKTAPQHCEWDGVAA